MDPESTRNSELYPLSSNTDALFPAIALSPYIVNHLTLYVWKALLRWANYLVQTKDIALVLNPPLKPSDFAGCSDSSLINGPVTSVSMPDIAAASYGGFALCFSRIRCVLG